MPIIKGDLLTFLLLVKNARSSSEVVSRLQIIEIAADGFLSVSWKHNFETANSIISLDIKKYIALSILIFKLGLVYEE